MRDLFEILHADAKHLLTNLFILTFAASGLAGGGSDNYSGMKDPVLKTLPLNPEWSKILNYSDLFSHNICINY